MATNHAPTLPACDAGPQRVVSLLGAATEIIYRLGLGHRLVGRSHECDYPPAVLALPMISRPRLNPKAPSKEIDAKVRSCAKVGEPIYALDDAELATLAPELLVTQDHCRVCAVTPRDVAASSCAAVPQLILKPSSLADCLDDVLHVALALGVPERGHTLRQTLQVKIDRVTEVVAGVAAAGKKKKRVAVLEWCDPVMGCGYWIPELVAAAGGECVLCPPPGGKTPYLTFNELLAAKPDVVVFALCGFGVARAVQEIEASWGAAQVAQLQSALAENSGLPGPAVFVTDGNFLVNRSGPRVAESAEVLAEAIHFRELGGHFGHHGTDFLATWDDALAMARAPRGEDREASGGANVAPLPSAAAQAWEEEAADSSEAEAAVGVQLALLAKGDFAGAFAMNSTANQARWCEPIRFVEILQGHAVFRRLLPSGEGAPQQPAAEVVPGAAAAAPGMRQVHVRLPPLPDTDEGAVLEWTMVLDQAGGGAGHWRTEKVGLAR